MFRMYRLAKPATALCVGTFRRTALTRCTRTFASKQNGSKDENNEKKEIAKDEGSKEVFNVKSKPSSAAPAPMDANSGIEKLLKKDNKPYIPKMKHERLTYEYPGLPNEDEFTRHANKIQTPKPVNRWSRQLPKIATIVVALWGGYLIMVWLYPAEDESDSNDLLDPYHFHKFRITHKKQIDEDHYLVEVMPKYSSWQLSYYANYDSKSIWNGDRLWSVEIKQPQISVVRSYTPLPLYFMKSERTRSGEEEPLLRVIENDMNDYDKNGVMTFYIKKYGDGEVSRFICDKNVGEELELRGPHVEYRFPYHPLKDVYERPRFRDLPSRVEPEPSLDNIKKTNKIPDCDNLVFFAAGTGIAPILQTLFSRNPYRGFVDIHYSARKELELEPFRRFLFFLSKLDRISLHEHYDSSPKTRLNKKAIFAPMTSNYVGALRLEKELVADSTLTAEERLRMRMAILNDQEPEETKINPTLKDAKRAPRFENALEQAMVTAQFKKSLPALSLVCGPDGYLSYVAGPKLWATNEQGPVGGLLGEKGWNNLNVYKL